MTCRCIHFKLCKSVTQMFMLKQFEFITIDHRSPKFFRSRVSSLGYQAKISWPLQCLFLKLIEYSFLHVWSDGTEFHICWCRLLASDSNISKSIEENVNYLSLLYNLTHSGRENWILVYNEVSSTSWIRCRVQRIYRARWVLIAVTAQRMYKNMARNSVLKSAEKMQDWGKPEVQSK